MKKRQKMAKCVTELHKEVRNKCRRATEEWTNDKYAERIGITDIAYMHKEQDK